MNEDLQRPAQLDRKIEQDVGKGFDEVYREVLSREEEIKNKELLTQFDNIRKHGFVTDKDVQEMIKPQLQPLLDKISQLEQQNIKLIEAFAKGRARGINSGAIEEGPPEAPDPYISTRMQLFGNRK